MPIRRRALMLVACLLAAPACAAELYRCVAANGAVSYQDAPCAGGSVLSKTIPVKIDAAPAEGKPAKAKSSRSKPSKPKAAETRSKGGAGARNQRRVACEQARNDRDAALARAGLSRTFAQLRALEDGVYEACKGL